MNTYRIKQTKDFYTPAQIFIDPGLEHHPFFARLTEYYPDVPIQVTEKPITLKDPYSAHDHASNGLLNLYLTQNLGKMFKPCPGISNYVCCNYFVINLVENCPLGCSYCFMANYLTNAAIRVNTNLESALNQIDEIQSKNPNRLYRVGTGEISDSLFLEDAIHSHKLFFPFFEGRTNTILEWKTKTNCIQWLLDYHSDKRTSAIPNILFSWSINPESRIREEETNTASLEERLYAAKQVVDLGYPVSFHFDPIMFYPNWKKDYTTTIENLFSTIPSKSIIYISLGMLRFNPGLKEIQRVAYPKSQLMTGELIQAPDGKVRYFKGIREEVFKHIKDTIESYDKDIVLYFCMEPSYMWENLFHYVPPARMRIDDRFKERLSNWIPVR